ncbi:MAG: Phosphatidylglycerophosphatase A [bacterium ADurb.Bin270]|nr:MAG: Phosphatidylglycerophosphatase A [bacterium ADurb.Bin270]
MCIAAAFVNRCAEKRFEFLLKSERLPLCSETLQLLPLGLLIYKGFLWHESCFAIRLFFARGGDSFCRQNGVFAMEKFCKFIATGCFSGYLMWAPGTWGSGVGVLVFILASRLGWACYVLFLAIIIALAIWSADRFAAISKEEDPKCVVIDEIAGYLVTMAFHAPTAAAIITGFILFRFFDIVKLFPASWFEKKLPGGLGIVMDDVMAGIYANAALFFIAWALSFAGMTI